MMEKRNDDGPRLGIFKEKIGAAKGLGVLLVGDAIIDEYCFSRTKGRATKDPIISVDFVRSEKYLGGILAVARHACEFAEKVDVVSLLGGRNPHDNEMRLGLPKNIGAKFFTRKDSFTTVKSRYIDEVRNDKLFKVEYIDDRPVSGELEAQIISHLAGKIPEYDIVLVGDYGHGLVTESIRRLLEKEAKFLAVNVQTNSTNLGFNYFTKYGRADYLTFNEYELRLALQDRHEPAESLLKRVWKGGKVSECMLTLGKKGSMFMEGGRVYSSPALAQSTLDTVGAGDAVFAVTSLLAHSKTSPELMPFYGNCVGAVAVQIMGNKESVGRERLEKFISESEKKTGVQS